MCDRWTAEDEKALVELQRRREEVMTKRRNVLRAVVESKLMLSRSVDTDEIVDQLIIHADAITDALKTFTRKEGIRIKQENDNGQN